MNVVIVDDCALDRAVTRDILIKYFKEHQFSDYALSEYADAETLLEAFQPNTINLLLLDIFMEGKDGLEAAREIMRLDPSVRIILLTSSIEHVLQGYEVQAKGYVLKPLTRHLRSFYRFLDHAMHDLPNSKRIFCADTPCGSVSVPFNRILYVESNNRKLYLHIDGKTLPLTAKMHDIREKLTEEDGFIECYRDLIVNLDRVKDTEEIELLLDNGERIPVSRRKKIPVQQRFLSRYAMRKAEDFPLQT